MTAVRTKAAAPVGTAVFVAGAAFWVLLGITGAFGLDALIYRAGAAEVLSGDPWTAGNRGWAFSAPPLEAFAFLPATLIPADLFAIGWVMVSAVAAVVIVRRLELPAWWLAFPPLIAGVVLGNPAIVGMAAILTGWKVVGLVLRPQLLLVASWRAVGIFAVLSLLALALRPDFIDVARNLVTSYGIQSGTPVNLWGSPLMVPALMSLALLWRVDRKAAAWLVMPAVGPAMGWYGYAMVMPVRSVFLGIACAIPIHGLGALAIVAYALHAILLNQSTSTKPADPGPTTVPSGASIIPTRSTVPAQVSAADSGDQASPSSEMAMK
jgi:hypothetical protein